MKNQNENNPYADIIDLPHHVSRKYPQMPIAKRAAQFSPFAALSGHGTAILEATRITEEKKILGEDMKDILDWKINALGNGSTRNPKLQSRILYQIPEKKAEHTLQPLDASKKLIAVMVYWYWMMVHKFALMMSMIYQERALTVFKGLA